MTQFRKRPIIIEAYQFTRESLGPGGANMPHWCASAVQRGTIKIYTSAKTPSLIIETLEGPMTASLDDWIIRGVKGELYACRDDIFQMTYERVEEVTASSVVRLEPIA